MGVGAAQGERARGEGKWDNAAAHSREGTSSPAYYWSPHCPAHSQPASHQACSMTAPAACTCNPTTFSSPQSYSKNLGLYAERIGALVVALSDKEAAARVLSQLKRIARCARCACYVNAALHGVMRCPCLVSLLLLIYRSVWLGSGPLTHHTELRAPARHGAWRSLQAMRSFQAMPTLPAIHMRCSCAVPMRCAHALRPCAAAGRCTATRRCTARASWPRRWGTPTCLRCGSRRWR